MEMVRKSKGVKRSSDPEISDVSVENLCDLLNFSCSTSTSMETASQASTSAATIANMAVPNNESAEHVETKDNLVFIIYSSEHPDILMDEIHGGLVLDHIQKSIRNALLNEAENFAPQLVTRRIEYGIKVVCENKETANWLMKHVFPSFIGKLYNILIDYCLILNKPIYSSTGPNIRVDQGQTEEVRNLTKCCSRLKKRSDGNQLTFEQLETFIRKQNPGLQVVHWKLYSRVELENDTILLYFGIDDADYQKLKERNGLIYFDTGRIKVQLEVNNVNKRV